MSTLDVLLVHPGIYDDVQPLLYPPWGILCTGTALRAAGAAVRVLDLNGADIEDTLARALSERPPDLIGVTAKVGRGATRLRRVVEVSRRCAPHASVVAGGPMTATFPSLEHAIWAGVDALLLGDGEQALPAWIAAGRPRGVHGPYEHTDLDQLGIPDWWEGLSAYVRPADWWPGMNVRSLHVSAARGCTRRCHFCYLNTHYPTTRLRMMSPSRIVQSMDRLHASLGVEGFYFVDDCFIDVPPTRTQQLCEQLIARGAPYRLGCDIQLSELEQPALLELMYSAGFRCFYLGLEAASAEVRRRLGKAPFTSDLSTALRRLADKGFFVTASIGMGWPGETAAEVEATLALLDSVPDLNFDAFRYTPLAGVPLSRSWVRRGGETSGPEEDFSELSRNHSTLDDATCQRLWSELEARQDARRERWFGQLTLPDAPEATAKPPAPSSHTPSTWTTPPDKQ
jgi:radical SAM superfamily enzyme YgiQ (UPF0313 family)